VALAARPGEAAAAEPLDTGANKEKNRNHATHARVPRCECSAAAGGPNWSCGWWGRLRVAPAAARNHPIHAMPRSCRPAQRTRPWGPRPNRSSGPVWVRAALGAVGGPDGEEASRRTPRGPIRRRRHTRVARGAISKVGIYRTLRFWIPFPDRYTDLPISYRDLGTLIIFITPVMWDVWFELQSRVHPLSHTATVTR